MIIKHKIANAFIVVLMAVLASGIAASTAKAHDPLASWNDGPAKTAILEFVAAVTEEGGKDYVAPEDRIATFDHDGTLWVEYPMYT